MAWIETSLILLLQTEETRPLIWVHSLNLEMTTVFIESPIYPNFFGTSAAAPHAGGVAALLISGSQKFRGTGMASDEIKSILQSTAIDMNTSGA